MKTFQITATLEKSGNTRYKVGGIASSFHRDLDGEAITPDAVNDAIPGFMASRGVDGIRGGPIRLNHGFSDQFIRNAIDVLNLPREEQLKLIAAVQLPLGRVTAMWVDDSGTTHWEGFLSEQNPVAKVIWDMLQEKLIHLGVSLGGKIYQIKEGGRDALGRLCRLITRIRLDELSITDNPALRLINDEAPGAYITALAKSIRSALTAQGGQQQVKGNGLKRRLRVATQDEIRRLAKTSMAESMGIPMAAGLGSQSNMVAIPSGITRAIAHTGSTTKPKGRRKVATSPTIKTGVGGDGSEVAPMARPRSGSTIPSGVWGLSVGKIATSLYKCGATMDKKMVMSPNFQKFLQQGAEGLGSVVSEAADPEPLLGLIRLLRYISMYSGGVPNMDDYQANGTIEAMGEELTKAIESFVDAVPKSMLKQTVRPPGATGTSVLDVVYTDQYRSYPY